MITKTVTTLATSCSRSVRRDPRMLLVRQRTLARRAALSLGAARTGLGVGALFFTGPTLKALLFGETDASGRALAKLAGGRDLALGLATLAARDEPGILRQLTLASTVFDAADAVSLSLAARNPASRLG